MPPEPADDGSIAAAAAAGDLVFVWVFFFSPFRRMPEPSVFRRKWAGVWRWEGEGRAEQRAEQNLYEREKMEEGTRKRSRRRQLQNEVFDLFTDRFGQYSESRLE